MNRYRPVGTLSVDVRWSAITSPSDPKWSVCNVLYAYLTPDKRTILNIGMAGYESVRDRFQCDSKKGFKNWAISQEINEGIIIVGEIETDAPRFTIEMLKDIESLLIYEIRPAGNVSNMVSRNITRPDLHVRCLGRVWPVQRDFYDGLIPPPPPSAL